MFEDMIELSFDDECLAALQSFAHPSNIGGEAQVAMDLKRIYALTIKDESGEWSYVKASPPTVAEGNLETRTSHRKSITIEPDPDEFFLARIKSTDKEIQDFLLLNFHQGGMFYGGRTFLTTSLLGLGFVPSVDEGHKHHITCEFSSEKLVITENFKIIKLDFLPEPIVKIACSKDGELKSLALEEAEKNKIAYFQEFIRKLLSDKISTDRGKTDLQLEEESKNEVFQLFFNSEQAANLIEFTVKHTVVLNSESKGIETKKLSKEDVSLKVQRQLYELSSRSSHPEFSKFLSPELRYALPKLFENPRTKSKVKNLILNSYREFMLLLFNIVFYLISSSIPAKTSFLPPQPHQSDESPDVFAYRMRP
ncbi:hypothetical protein [Rickettsiella endosymbiont of Aleochara curtula]|uniref:hypothetical protein n=1 Tax=Rickettsiella endosymbiont of Aleochara curtula TaxID=3077936 RepID=UPI00313B8B0E